MGTCLPSLCPETSLVRPPISGSLRSNGSTRHRMLWIWSHCARSCRDRVCLSYSVFNCGRLWQPDPLCKETRMDSEIVVISEMYPIRFPSETPTIWLRFFVVFLSHSKKSTSILPKPLPSNIVYISSSVRHPTVRHHIIWLLTAPWYSPKNKLPKHTGRTF
jgi:hypothetical protein